MKLRVRCNGRAENTNPKDGSPVWSYAFIVTGEGGVPPKQTVQFQLTSTEMLHYKRGQDYTLHLTEWSGIEVIKGKGPIVH